MIKYLIHLVSLILFITPTFAQSSDTTWTAYLFDTINNDLIRVASDGTAQPYALGITDGDLVSQNEVAISNDGATVAYCKTTSQSYPMADKSLVIRDIISETTLHEVELGEQHGCAVTAFNTDDSLLALSIVHFPGMEPAPQGEAQWSLNLVDVASGETVQTLSDAGDSIPTTTLFTEDTPYLANITVFSDRIVQFFAYPYLPMGGPATVPAMAWDIEADNVIELPPEYGRVGNDYLPATGDLVYPALDETLPAAMPDGPLPQANIVNIITGDALPETIYTIEDWFVINTTFVDNGNRVAVLLMRGFEEGLSPDITDDLRIDVVGLDGTVQTIDRTFEGGAGIANLADGMLIVNTPNNPQAPTSVFTYIDGTLTEVVVYQPEYDDLWSPPQLLWVSPVPVR